MFLNPKEKQESKAWNGHCWNTSSQNKGLEQQLLRGLWELWIPAVDPMAQSATRAASRS